MFHSPAERHSEDLQLNTQPLVQPSSGGSMELHISPPSAWKGNKTLLWAFPGSFSCPALLRALALHPLQGSISCLSEPEEGKGLKGMPSPLSFALEGEALSALKSGLKMALLYLSYLLCTKSPQRAAGFHAEFSRLIPFC